MLSVITSNTSRTIIRSSCHPGRLTVLRLCERQLFGALSASPDSSYSKTMATTTAASTASSPNASARSITEVQVPTPWGHLATKCWNLPSTENPLDLSSSTHLPVVCLHGWQDNAGTFDKLIPLLDNDIPFICVDFAGHGKSSHRPLGSSSDAPMNTIDVKRVVDHFHLNESGFNLMGHSMGGTVSITMASVFPQIVRKCLTFDAPATIPRDAAETHLNLASAINKSLEYEKNLRPAPKYSYEEAYQRFMKGRNHQLSEESARILLKRGLKLVDETESGESLYEFARDIRITFPSLLPFSLEQTEALIRNVSCHLRLILFKDNYWFGADAADEKWRKMYLALRFAAFGIYKANCRSFEWKELEGRHHGHLDHPEVMAAEINSFLKMGDSKL